MDLDKMLEGRVATGLPSEGVSHQQLLELFDSPNGKNSGNMKGDKNKATVGKGSEKLMGAIKKSRRGSRRPGTRHTPKSIDRRKETKRSKVKTEVRRSGGGERTGPEILLWQYQRKDSGGKMARGITPLGLTCYRPRERLGSKNPKTRKK